MDKLACLCVFARRQVSAQAGAYRQGLSVRNFSGCGLKTIKR